MSYTKKHLFAPLPQTTRGQPVRLSGDPKGKNFLYTNGKSVFIRNIENPSIAAEYTEHTYQTTVARYSPTGYYIASGDIHGNVRIWDTVGEEQILKSEIKVVAGRINDIAWDGESQRIIAVGDGKERYGHAFSFDSLTSAGEIIGHSKPINSVAIRHQRPFRAVTASDDITVVFYTGVPFKYAHIIKDHTRFVQSVGFAPDGSAFVSVGADGKIFLYDGKTGEKLHELVSVDQHHTGGIFSVAWSPDSSRLLTSSADSTVKIWDVQAQSVVRTFDLSTAAATPDTQQVGNLWQGDHLLSLALSGEINYLDPNSGEVARTVKGHQKAITALTIGAPSSATFFTGSYDGRAHAWHYGRDADRAVAEPLKGDGHANQITAMAIAGDAVFSAGMDDVVKFASVEKVGYSATTVPTGSQPRYVSASPSGTLVVATIDNVQAYDRTGHRLATLSNPGFNPTAVAITPDAQTVIVGGDDNRSRAYRLADGALTLLPDLELASNRGAITALAVSPQGTHLAAGDAQGKIFVYDLGTGEVVVTQWVFHSARVNSLAWSANGKFVVSGSLDTNVFVWNLDNPGKRVQIKKAHIAGVNGVGWAGEREVVSVGQDATVKVWEVVLPQ